MPLVRAAEAIEEIRRGRAVIVVDDSGDEAEGNFVVAAEQITPDWVNFMAKHGRGLVYLTLTEERARELDLGPMDPTSPQTRGKAFTVSIEAREGVTTGISAADRATTIQKAIDPGSTARDLVRPGHVFPLIARPGGVLVRVGQAEASVDLARLAGLRPGGVICEILRDDGKVARRADLERLAQEFDLKIVSIVDLITYRRRNDKLVERDVEVDVNYVHGSFHTVVYRSAVSDAEHMAFVKGDVADGGPVLVRMQAAVPMAGLNADLGIPTLLDAPMRRIEKEGRGVIVIIGQPGGGERVSEAFRRFLEAEDGRVTPDRNEEERLRDYGMGAQILEDLGVKRIRLLTNRPRRIVGLEGFDLSVEEVVSLGEPGSS